VGRRVVSGVGEYGDIAEIYWNYGSGDVETYGEAVDGV